MQELLNQNIPGTGKVPTRFDNSLHRYWVDRCGNRYIRDFFDRHGAYFAALLDYAAIGGTPAVGIGLSAPGVILDSLLRKKWHQAREALRYDIQRLRPILKDTIHSPRGAGNGNGQHG